MYLKLFEAGPSPRGLTTTAKPNRTNLRLAGACRASSAAGAKRLSNTKRSSLKDGSSEAAIRADTAGIPVSDNADNAKPDWMNCLRFAARHPRHGLYRDKQGGQMAMTVGDARIKGGHCPTKAIYPILGVGQYQNLGSRTVRTSGRTRRVPHFVFG
jgi:hypothetical protein